MKYLLYSAVFLCKVVAFDAVLCGMLFVIYGSSVFSGVFAITERSEIALYNVPMFMSLLGFGIGMMFSSYHL